MKAISGADYDVVIAGAGVSGALLAYNLSKSGFSVFCLEKGNQNYIRTIWTNDIPIWSLQSGLLNNIDVPENFTPEITAVLDQSGNTAFYFDTQKIVRSVDMKKLVKNLRDAAIGSGAEIWFNSELREVLPEAGGVSVQIKTPRGKMSLRSRYVIDCTGAGSPVRKNFFRDEMSDADYIYAYRLKFDVKGSAISGFYDRHRLASDSAVLRLSENGGFNTTAIFPDIRNETVEILCGGNDRDIPKRISEIVKKEFGTSVKPVAGGGGIIPVRRPFLRLFKDGVFSIGDSASMIYPMCASGISTIITASEMLIESLKTDSPYSFQGRFNNVISQRYALMTFFRRIIEEADRYDTGILFDLVINPVSIRYVFDNKPIINPENVVLTLRRGLKLIKRPSIIKKAGIYLLAGSLDSVLYSLKPAFWRSDYLNLLESRLVRLFTR